MNSGLLHTRIVMLSSVSNLSNVPPSSCRSQVPYNVERLLYWSCQGDTARVRSLMAEFEQKQAVKIPEEMHHWIKQRIVGEKKNQGSSLLLSLSIFWNIGYSNHPKVRKNPTESG